MGEFIPGLVLAELFYKEAVRPILSKHFLRFRYSAALIGHGSEVLGFDTQRSTDHHWGPRVQLFLRIEDYAQYRHKLKEIMSRELPVNFKGYPTNWGKPDKKDKGVQKLIEIESGPVNHRVEILTVKSFVKNLLGVDPYQELDVLDWLTFPQQELLCLTAGEVFHDSLDLRQVRAKFKYFPEDVWLFILASQWMKISQEEAFPGRCAEVGDDIGSIIITARLVRELIRLCFILEKTYIPYSKWLGAAFSRLKCSQHLAPLFLKALSADSWKEREALLSLAYEAVGNLHNSLGITEHIEAKVTQFHSRQFLVLNAERFARATMAVVRDDRLKAIGLNIGSVDQFDGSDATTNPRLTRRMKALFE
ncbi:MAG TPA: DUF4037 domain-containing protein [Dehalococcoidales bacterium]